MLYNYFRERHLLILVSRGSVSGMQFFDATIFPGQPHHLAQHNWFVNPRFIVWDRLSDNVRHRVWRWEKLDSLLRLVWRTGNRWWKKYNDGKFTLYQTIHTTGEHAYFEIEPLISYMRTKLQTATEHAWIYSAGITPDISRPRCLVASLLGSCWFLLLNFPLKENILTGKRILAQTIPHRI